MKLSTLSQKQQVKDLIIKLANNPQIDLLVQNDEIILIDKDKEVNNFASLITQNEQEIAAACS
jgi:hypothetical protein